MSAAQQIPTLFAEAVEREQLGVHGVHVTITAHEESRDHRLAELAADALSEALPHA